MIVPVPVPVPELELSIGLVAREPGQYETHPSLLVSVGTVDQLRRYLAAEPGDHRRHRHPEAPTGAGAEADKAFHDARVELASRWYDEDDSYGLPEARWCGLYVSARCKLFAVEVELREEAGAVVPVGWIEVYKHVVAEALTARIRRALTARIRQALTALEEGDRE